MTVSPRWRRAAAVRRAVPARVRRGFAVLGALATATVLVQSAVAAAQTVPATGTLGPVPHLAGLDLSADLFAPIAPLRPEFVRSTLGDSAFAVFDAPPRPGRGPDTIELDPARFVPPPPVREPDTVGPPIGPFPTTTTTTRVAILPGVGKGELVVLMAADRTTAHTADPITYTITVRNIGDRGFVGDATIRSHIPVETTEQAPTQCDGQPLPTNPNGICQQVSVPVPGSSNPDVHQIQNSWSFSQTHPLAAGDAVSFSFTVTVNPGVTVGTVIENHAHLTLVGDPDQTTETVRVTVV